MESNFDRVKPPDKLEERLERIEYAVWGLIGLVHLDRISDDEKKCMIAIHQFLEAVVQRERPLERGEGEEK